MFLIYLVAPVFAQVEIEVTTDSVIMSKGLQPAYITMIPQTSMKPVKKVWSRKIKNKTKSKIITKDNELSLQSTYIDEIHSEPINVYSFLYEINNKVKLVSLFEIDSLFFSYHDSTDIGQERIHFGIVKFMKEFAISEYTKSVQKELVAAEMNLDLLNKELKKIENKHEAYNKEVMTNEQKIKNSEDKILSLEKDNERKIEQIDRKKEAIDAITEDKNLYEVAKDQLKDLEKDKKKIEKSLEYERKEIIEFESAIFKANRKISKNLDLYDKKVEEIEEQQAKIEAIKAKLNIQ